MPLGNIIGNCLKHTKETCSNPMDVGKHLRSQGARRQSPTISPEQADRISPCPAKHVDFGLQSKYAQRPVSSHLKRSPSRRLSSRATHCSLARCLSKAGRPGIAASFCHHRILDMRADAFALVPTISRGCGCALPCQIAPTILVLS